MTTRGDGGRRIDVAIVGAGVVGASAALALARAGLRVAIVEAHAPAPWRADAPDLRVYALAPDAQALFVRLGAWDAIAGARVSPYRRMQVWDAIGGGELVFDADQLGRPELGHIVEHGLLVDRLWNALASQPNVRRHCPAKAAAIAQDDDGVVLQLDDDTRIEARLLLGADGAGSRVAALAGIEASERDYGQRGLVCYVRTALPHAATCWQRCLPDGPLALLPCADGRSSTVWSLQDAEAQRLLDADADAFGAELTRALDRRLGECSLDSARGAGRRRGARRPSAGRAGRQPRVARRRGAGLGGRGGARCGPPAARRGAPGALGAHAGQRERGGDARLRGDPRPVFQIRPAGGPRARPAARARRRAAAGQPDAVAPRRRAVS
jgi:2-octaprenyl-3-methyl-6-methoxy-1,4-benzoquinol hydroxylase